MISAAVLIGGLLVWDRGTKLLSARLTFLKANLSEESSLSLLDLILTSTVVLFVNAFFISWIYRLMNGPTNIWIALAIGGLAIGLPMFLTIRQGHLVPTTLHIIASIGGGLVGAILGLAIANNAYFQWILSPILAVLFYR
jgi:hypothetical protein